MAAIFLQPLRLQETIWFRPERELCQGVELCSVQCQQATNIQNTKQQQNTNTATSKRNARIHNVKKYQTNVDMYITQQQRWLQCSPQHTLDTRVTIYECVGKVCSG